MMVPCYERPRIAILYGSQTGNAQVKARGMILNKAVVVQA